VTPEVSGLAFAAANAAASLLIDVEALGRVIEAAVAAR
jgi:hypothetical protein